MEEDDGADGRGEAPPSTHYGKRGMYRGPHRRHYSFYNAFQNTVGCRVGETNIQYQEMQWKDDPDNLPACVPMLLSAL